MLPKIRPLLVSLLVAMLTVTAFASEFAFETDQHRDVVDRPLAPTDLSSREAETQADAHEFSEQAVVQKMGGLSVGINGCFSSGTGDFECSASVHGGSGSYNYWWMYQGTGQLYQTNSSNVSITGCTSGEGTLTVQVLDRVTQDTARSRSFQVSCGCAPGGDDPGCGPFGGPFG